MLNIASTGLSSCHKAEMRVVGDETMHYECTICGEACDIWSSIPPVNESMDKKIINIPMIYYHKKLDRFTVENDCQDGWYMSRKEVEPLLSTARQEERERFSGWIAEAFSETNDIVQMQKLLRKKLNMVDSLTSKGGTT